MRFQHTAIGLTGLGTKKDPDNESFLESNECWRCNDQETVEEDRQGLWVGMPEGAGGQVAVK